MAVIKIDLTELGLFSGLYNSIWDNDSETIQQEEIISVCEDIFEDCSFYTIVKNKESLLKDIAELFCNALENSLEGTFEYESSWSPKFYNYDTDHIYLKWTVEDKTEDSSIEGETLRDMLETFLLETDNLSDYEIFSVFDYNGNGDNVLNDNYDIIMIVDGNEYIIKDINEDSVELQSI